MAGFNFRDRQDIDDTLELLRERRAKPVKVEHGTGDPTRFGIKFPKRVSETLILKTPTGGIDGIAGSLPGSAECTPYYINISGTPTLTELLDNDGASQTFTVYHIGTADIEEEVFIQAYWNYGVLLAVWEDCA